MHDEVEAIKVQGVCGVRAKMPEARPAVVVRRRANPADRVFVPLHLTNGLRDLRLLNMVATFGTVLDVTAAELVIEVFYPADPATAQALEGIQQMISSAQDRGQA